MEKETLKITEELSNTGKEEYIRINKSKRFAKIFLNVFDLIDGNFFISYIPSLNISGYGSTQSESREMLKVSLVDYFQNLSNLKQPLINAELIRLGWKKSMYKKQFNNTVHIDKDGILRNFNMPKDTLITESSLQMA